MATFRGLYPDWRGYGDFDIYDQKVLHLHLLHDARISGSLLFHCCILDQFEALYASSQKKSLALQLDYCLS
jgi:hypothetical protein